jgi:pimeloyl-ACP methyl ester carboxylesterase
VRGAQAQKAPARAATPPYLSILADETGAIEPAALDRLATAMKAEAQGGPVQVVVLVHGFNTSLTLGRRQYRTIARSLRKEAATAGWKPIVVGVHWASHPGPPLRWMPRMLGYRFLSAAGFPNAVRNPYLEKVKVAETTGRIGLRALLFRIEDELPGVPVNVFAHSMGSEVLLRALAPRSVEAAAAASSPMRSPKLGMVVLAGADLDQYAFAPGEEGSAASALPMARLWWITVPKRNSADAALELRRAAGRRDAMGNVGLALTREQFASLLARRGLLIDNRSVPIAHDLTDYFPRDRIQSLVSSLRYLQSPEAPEAKTCTLAILDRILKADPSQLPSVVHVRGPSARIYVRWRMEVARPGYGSVKIIPPPSAPEPGRNAPGGTDD